MIISVHFLKLNNSNPVHFPRMCNSTLNRSYSEVQFSVGTNFGKGTGTKLQGLIGSTLIAIKTIADADSHIYTHAKTKQIGFPPAQLQTNGAMRIAPFTQFSQIWLALFT